MTCFVRLNSCLKPNRKFLFFIIKLKVFFFTIRWNANNIIPRSKNMNEWMNFSWKVERKVIQMALLERNLFILIFKWRLVKVLQKLIYFYYTWIWEMRMVYHKIVVIVEGDSQTPQDCTNPFVVFISLAFFLFLSLFVYVLM